MSTLASVIIRDVIANLPAAGIPGRLFFASDTGAALRDNGTSWDTLPLGTVSSVGLAVPGWQSVSGSPLTGPGTITISDNTETANEVFAGPASGSAAAPTFRALAPADLPVATTSALGAVKPDGTTITISAGVISAAAGGGTFLEETITFSGTSGAFAHSPSRLYGLYRNGIRMSSLSGTPAIQKFSATGTAITLSTAAGGSDVFIAVYEY